LAQNSSENSPIAGAVHEEFGALPERWVTVHSGDMGYTIGPFAGRAKCPGRSVTRWMNG
jgi:hypothetical protein